MGMLLRRHTQKSDTGQLGRRAPPIAPPEEPTPKRAAKSTKQPKAPTSALIWPNEERLEQEKELELSQEE